MSQGTHKSLLITIVGAGPGDPDLITVKGMKAIKQADVILYDALTSTELLNCARANCEKIFVGKRKGHRIYKQEEINDLLFAFASQSKRVVRLKGGDSFVFGRGHEEFEFAVRKGIAVEVIPGITSALAAPASVGIPVTKRGVNESFMVVTGMLSNGKPSQDIELAAKTSATIIIIMGMTHLKEIALTIAAMRSPREPMAVIQNGTMPEEKVVMGNASNILSLVQTHGLGSPAVIVVGKVVEEGRHLNDLINQNNLNSVF